MTNVSNLLNKLENLEKEIEEIYSEIDKKHRLKPNFFKVEQWSLKEKQDSEFNFDNMVFHLYKVYYERAKVNIEVITEFVHLCELEKEDVDGVKRYVHAFRTIKGHYLEDNKRKRDFNKICSEWYQKTLETGRMTPINDEEWKICFCRLTETAIKSFENTKRVLLEIINLNQVDIYIQWYIRQNNDIEKYKKISVIETIRQEYDFTYDSEIIYQKYVKNFDDMLKILKYDDKKSVEENLKPSYEKIILDIGQFPCPLSGKEAKELFRIDREQLAVVMKRATEIYKKDVKLTKEDLILKVSIELELEIFKNELRVDHNISN